MEMSLEEGDARVKFTKEEKQATRAKWKNAIIVRLYGGTLSLEYLKFKESKIWFISGGVQFFDLGKGFFSIRFDNCEDMGKIE